MITNEHKITIEDDKIKINKDKDKNRNQSRGQDNNRQSTDNSQGGQADNKTTKQLKFFSLKETLVS